LNLKILNFGEMNVIFIGICFCEPDFVKSDNFSLRYSALTISKWRRPPSWIFEISSFCHIIFFRHAILLHLVKNLLKSDNRLMSYGRKGDFQDGGCCLLEFLKFQFLIT